MTAIGALAITMPAVDPADAMTSPVGCEVAQPDRAWRVDLAYVFLADDGTATMSGTVDDIAQARRHRRSGGPLLWFRRDGAEYVVRNPNALRDLDGLWTRENVIDAERDAVAARAEAAGERLGRLAARERRGVAPAERRAIGEQTAALDRELLDLERRLGALDRRKEDASRETRARLGAWVERVVASGAAQLVR